MQLKKALKISMIAHIRAYMKLNNEYINLTIIKDTLRSLSWIRGGRVSQ
jgi:hypothetical protein